MVTKKDYDTLQVDAARSVLLELVRLLAEYRDDIVVVGGWVPALLIPQDRKPHIGSTDVDLALNHRTLTGPGYKTICRLLEGRGYTQDKRQPFVFWRTVKVGDKEIVVEVDLLAGEYEGTGKTHRTQSVQDVRARKARGCDLAFQIPARIAIEGNLPGGARDSATVCIASIVPFLVMKGMALATRLKEKDAWDIYYCVRWYPGEPAVLVDVCREHIKNGLVKEGFKNIAEKFASPDHTGPTFVADFEEISDLEARAVTKRDAFERVQYLLQGVGVA
ncbi:MAG: hypothetical protein ABSB49_09245 [Polyangia bacterium]